MRFSFLDRMRLSTQVGAALSALALLLVLMLALTTVFIGRLEGRVQAEIVDLDGRNRALTDIQFHSLQCRRFEKDMFLNHRDAARLAAYEEQWSVQVAAVKASLDALANAPSDLEYTTADVLSWNAGVDRYAANVRATLARLRTGGLASAEAANAAMEPSKGDIRKFTDDIYELARHEAVETHAAHSEVLAGAAQFRTLATVGLAIGLSVAGLMCVFLPLRIARRARALQQMADDLGAGNTDTVRTVSGSDELGRVGVRMEAMARALSEKSVALEKINQNLESIVAARTEERDRFFTMSLDMLCLAGFDGKFKRCNVAWTKTLGYKPEELEGTPFIELIHPDDVAAVARQVERLAQDGTVETFEVRCKARDGGYRWTNWNAIRFANSDIFYAAGRDISERKHMEEAQRDAAARLNDAQRIGNVGSWEAELLTGTSSWSDESYRIFGFKPGEIKIAVDTYYSMIHPEDLSRVQQEWGKAMQSARRHVTEHRIVWRDGTVREIAGNMDIVCDEHGKAVKLLGTCQDITERREREAALQRGEQRLRAIVDTALDAVVTIGADGCITGWNPAAETVFGWTAAEAQGRDVADLIIPPAFRDPHRAGVSRWVQTRESRLLGKRMELTAVHKDGREFPIEIAISGAEVGSGLVFSAFLRDISQAKEAEKRRAEYASEIEKKNRELDVALEKANEATRLKSEFLANMSHEIRTPMNGVIGMVGLLAETNLTAEQREYADVIRGSGEALLSIINDILDFSKIEAGKMTLEPTAFNLHGAIHEVAELLAAQAHSKGLELLVRYDGSAPRRVVADAGRLRQILLNLVGNAVKFTGAGSVLIAVENRGSDNGRARLRVAVKDTGIGIPPEKQSRLFQKFSQADASTTREFGGTGLGLAICKQLVELMHGTIGVESVAGKGSTFWFEISVAVDEDIGGEVTLSIPPSARAIVVDDDPNSRKVLSHLCANVGLQADAADSGMAALRMMREKFNEGAPYVVALCDMRMPVMDGAQLARAIKSDDRLKDVRIIIVSAHVKQEDITMPVGMVEAVLSKPLRTETLTGVLKRIFNPGTKITTTTSVKPTEPTPSHEAAFAGRRVLLAEDNAVNQKLAIRILERLGCHIDVAGNGVEAVQMFSRLPYDLVFMDCQMPEMDGYEATRRIRVAQDGARRIPIVAMTANAMQGDREKCLDSGMDDYISKPMKIEDVRNAVSKWVAPVK
ncbi:MAG: PAS domain S-box protein [Planctomycetes bacterium]|nr:PAS domain S-box protein [Planctomycetota bacterium]